MFGRRLDFTLLVSLDHIFCLVFYSAVLVADVAALQRLLGCAAVTGIATPTQAFNRLQSLSSAHWEGCIEGVHSRDTSEAWQWLWVECRCVLSY